MSTLNCRAALARTVRTAAAVLLLAGAAAPAVGAAPADEERNPQQDPATPIPALRLKRLFPELPLKRPLQVVQAPGDTSRIFILEQAGRVLTVDLGKQDAKQAEVFMDLRKTVNDRANEEGLLSLAFHPDFQRNGIFFCYYTAESPKRSVLSRFKASDDRQKGVAESEEVLLEVGQPYWNHNGGTVAFGPDGMLYLGLGDGGAANDPQFNGQNLGTHLAKILRIDVNGADPGRKYAVPKDNPFVGTRGAKPEIWAFGLRNPWRMSFDRKTGDLWVGDVGQNAWEEIDIVTRGGNYGWNPREGFHEFPQGKPGEFGSDYRDPVVDYGRRDGGSVTGGCVYRGTAYPTMDGLYFYGDFNTGRLWALRMENGKATRPKVLVNGGKSRWSSIDQLNDGRIICTSMEGGERGPGAIFEIVPAE